MISFYCNFFIPGHWDFLMPRIVLSVTLDMDDIGQAIKRPVYAVRHVLGVSHKKHK